MTTTTTQAGSATVYVCPERDIECGRNSKNWCAKCPQHDIEQAKTEAAAARSKVDGTPAGSATGIDLDVTPFTSAELDEMEAVARAAPSVWYGTYQIVDGISDEKAVALIEACSPDTILALIALARATPQNPSTPAVGAVELPKLPEPFGTMDVYADDGSVTSRDGYTADQMRGYAFDAATPLHSVTEQAGDAQSFDATIGALMQDRNERNNFERELAGRWDLRTHSDNGVDDIYTEDGTWHGFFGWCLARRAQPLASTEAAQPEQALNDDDICAFQHALQQLEWIASGTTPGRNCDLYDDRNKANIKHAMQHAESALARFRPAYSRLLDMYKEERESNRAALVTPASTAPVKATGAMCRAAREKFGIGANYADHIYSTMVAEHFSQASTAASEQAKTDAHTTSYNQGYRAGVEIGQAMAADTAASEQQGAIHFARLRNSGDKAWTEHDRDLIDRMREQPDVYEVRTLYAEPGVASEQQAGAVAAWANPRDLETDTHIDCWAYKTTNYTVPLYRHPAPRKTIELVDCGTCGCQVSVPVDHFDTPAATLPSVREDERALFERAHPKMILERQDDGKYFSGYTQIAWEGWQDAQARAALTHRATHAEHPCASGCQMNTTGDPQNDCGDCMLAAAPEGATHAATTADLQGQAAIDALDGMGFTYDMEIGWLPPAATTASASGWKGLPPIGERESIVDVCGLPQLMREIIETKGSPVALGKLYDFIDAWGRARVEFASRIPAPSREAGAVLKALGARLAWMLDDDQFNNVESMLLAIGAALTQQGAAQAKAGDDARDAERLDWLVINEAWICYNPEITHCRVLHQTDEGDVGPLMGTADRFWYGTPRAAIDAAMAAPATSAIDEADSEGGHHD